MEIILGFIMAVISGMLDGSYGAVMKLTKKWEWENIWLLFSIISLVIFPLILALWAVPNLMDVYRDVETAVLWRTFLLGVGWGVGSVLFGLGLYMLGQSFAYTVMMGIIAVGGSLIPMLVTNPGSVLTVGGILIILAMVVTIYGVTLCGTAGKLRDDHSQEHQIERKTKHSFKAAFMVCLGGGIFSCMFNLAFHFAPPIAVAAANQLGDLSTSFRSNSPIWALVLLGGFIPNFVYCVYLLITKGTWKKFTQPKIGNYWLFGILMGAIFSADVTIYGIAALKFGKLGTTVAWIIYITAGILIANFWGVITGEWEKASPKATQRMIQGCWVLVVSIVLVNIGDLLLS
jgi:L-rhamnose-H+ transport protein